MPGVWDTPPTADELKSWGVASASQPRARTQRNPPPAGQARPNPKRATNTAPAEADYPLFGGGAGIGGAIGSTVGSVGGLPGRMVGGALGGFIGNLSQQNIDKNPKPGVQFDMSGSEPVPTQPDAPAGPDKPLDYGQAGKAALVQGGIPGAMAGLGAGAAKLGFPRVAAFLGATSPRQAVLNRAPQSAGAVSQDALQGVDAAAQLSPGAAVQKAASGARSAAHDIPVAEAAEQAKSALPGIQSGLAGGARELAPLNKNLAGAVEQAITDSTGAMTPEAIEAALKAGKMTPAEALRKLTAGEGDQAKGMITAAFRHPNAFPATAGSSEVAAARIPVAAAASEQGARGSALGMASDAIAKAQARNLPSSAQLSANAQGLNDIANLGVKIPFVGKLGKILSTLQGEPGSGVTQVGMRGGQRASQTVSALLGDNAAKPLSATTRPSGGAGNALAGLLEALARNRNPKDQK